MSNIPIRADTPADRLRQAEAIADLPLDKLIGELWKCVKMKSYRKFERIIAALIRERY